LKSSLTYEAQGEADGMTIQSALYRRRRFPAEIIRRTVWLSHPFSLSVRGAELILAKSRVVETHDNIRHWCHESGAQFAKQLRQRGPGFGDI
jgi:putative transposase